MRTILDAAQLRAKTQQIAPAKMCSGEANEVGKQMQAAYQKIEQAWKRAEEILALVRVPRDVSVKVSKVPLGDYGQSGEFETFLTYTRMKSGWRICWCEITEWYNAPPDQNTERDERPIVDWPFDIRVGGFEHFKALHDEVVKVAREYVPLIDEKVNAFAEILESLDFDDK